MSQGKQLPLHGARCGPLVSPQQAHHVPRRGCRLLSALIKFLVTFLITFTVTALVLWMILWPFKLAVHVEKASLAQFNLTINGASLYYNMTLEVSVRNPNKRIGVCYERLEGGAYYHGNRFGYVVLPAFYQERKNTTTLYPAFDGQSLVTTGNHGLLQVFNSERNDGFFRIDVVIYARARFKVGSYRTRRYKPEFKCELRVPLVATNGSLINGFTRTECDVDIW